MDFVEIFKNFGSLFETFQYYSILLIVGVTSIMIPINILWKKAMKKESLERLRKTVSVLSVYVLSIAAVCLFTLCTHTKLTFEYVSGASLSLGVCSQFLWFIIKLIRDFGFKRLIKFVSENVDWKKALKSFGAKFNIDTKITDIIATEVENKYLAEINADAVKAFTEHEKEMIASIYSKLSGFVETKDLQTVSIELFKMLKDAWINPTK